MRSCDHCHRLLYRKRLTLDFDGFIAQNVKELRFASLASAV